MSGAANTLLPCDVQLDKTYKGLKVQFKGCFLSVYRLFCLSENNFWHNSVVPEGFNVDYVTE
jgi:hypothetical protein